MQIRIVRSLALSALLLAAGVVPALAQGGGGGGRPPMGPPLQLSSSAFTDVGPYPDKYSCIPGMAGGPPDAGKMVSPPLSWVNAPAGTKLYYDKRGQPLLLKREIGRTRTIRRTA